MKKRILIIDDNPMNCEDYVAPLNELYSVVICMSLRDAVRRILLYHYDLIVIDIMMPTSGTRTKDELKTGLYFYDEQLKRLDNSKKLRFLFWSNLSQNTYNEFFSNNKPDNVDFVHKEPRNKNHLLEKVKQLLGE